MIIRTILWISKKSLKIFSQKRHLAALTTVIVLLTVISLNHSLPIGPGNYNQIQISKIHHSAPYLKVQVKGNKVDKEVIRFPSLDYNWVDRFFYNLWTYLNGFWVTHKLASILSLIVLILGFDLFIGSFKKLN